MWYYQTDRGISMGPFPDAHMRGLFEVSWAKAPVFLGAAHSLQEGLHMGHFAAAGLLCCATRSF